MCAVSDPISALIGFGGAGFHEIVGSAGGVWGYSVWWWGGRGGAARIAL